MNWPWVLGPWKFEFGNRDDSAAVAEILRNTWGYQRDRAVTYQANPEEDSHNVTARSFAGWDRGPRYDLVHVSAHAERIETDAFTGTVVKTSELGERYSLYEDTDLVGVARYDGEVVLIPDFFEEQYANGLARAFVFLNACQTGQASDLANVLLGTRSGVLAWDESVNQVAAYTVSQALYKELAAGWPLKDAIDRVQSRSRMYSFAQARSLKVFGDNIRIREIIRLLHPNADDRPLADCDVLPIEGTAGDGEPDDLPLVLRLDGVDEEKLSEFTIDLEINDIEVGLPFTIADKLASGEAERLRDGDHDWYRIEHTVPLLDDVDPELPYRLRAFTSLPEGGESKHVVPEVYLTNSGDSAAELNIEVGTPKMEGQTPAEMPDVPDPGAMLELPENLNLPPELQQQVDEALAEARERMPENVPATPDLPDVDLPQRDLEARPAVMWGKADGDELPRTGFQNPWTGEKRLHARVNHSFMALDPEKGPRVTGVGEGTAELHRAEDRDEWWFTADLDTTAQVARLPNEGDAPINGTAPVKTDFHWHIDHLIDHTAAAAYRLTMEMTHEGPVNGEYLTWKGGFGGGGYWQDGHPPINVVGAFEDKLPANAGLRRTVYIEVPEPPEGVTRRLLLGFNFKGWYNNYTDGQTLGMHEANATLSGRLTIEPVDPDEIPETQPALERIPVGGGPVAALPPLVERWLGWG